LRVGGLPDFATASNGYILDSRLSEESLNTVDGIRPPIMHGTWVLLVAFLNPERARSIAEPFERSNNINERSPTRTLQDLKATGLTRARFQESCTNQVTQNLGHVFRGNGGIFGDS
jgi:hypothetical protein